MNEGETRTGLQCVCRELEACLESLRNLQRRQPVTPQEGRYRDLDTDPDFPTEVRAVLGCLFTDCLEPAIQSLRDLASYEPGNGTGRPARDPGEVAREVLYKLVVQDNFTARPLDPRADQAEVWVPPYTPEEAGLEVFHQHGRWFATWLKLEEPEDAPETQRREVLRLDLDRMPEYLVYTEV